MKTLILNVYGNPAPEFRTLLGCTLQLLKQRHYNLSLGKGHPTRVHLAGSRNTSRLPDPLRK